MKEPAVQVRDLLAGKLPPSGAPTSTRTIQDALARLFEEYAKRDGKTSFIGVYLLKRGILALGPYWGPSTEHDLIPISRGVVGKCAETRATLVVDDVSKCEYYLSCCSTVRSEVVVPLLSDGELVGVLDLDSRRLAAYGAADVAALEELGRAILPHCARLVSGLRIQASW